LRLNFSYGAFGGRSRLAMAMSAFEGQSGHSSLQHDDGPLLGPLQSSDGTELRTKTSSARRMLSGRSPQRHSCRLVRRIRNASTRDSSDREISTAVPKTVIVLRNDSTPPCVRKRRGTTTASCWLAASKLSLADHRDRQDTSFSKRLDSTIARDAVLPAQALDQMVTPLAEIDDQRRPGPRGCRLRRTTFQRRP